MLTHLHVRNLAVVEDASVEFGPGLNVLTGETGAGKSIIVDALALLSGVRADSDLIRRGAERLTVAGIFQPSGDRWREPLVAAGLELDHEDIVVRREISASGPNRVFLNDQPITLRLLADIAPGLMRIHTQREELGLVSPEFQRRLLDRIGGQKGRQVLEGVRAAYDSYRDVRATWKRLAGDQKERLERLDLLRYQQREIDDAKVVAGEEEALRAERDVLRNSEAIRAALGGSLVSLFEDEGSASDRLALAVKSLSEVSDWEPQATSWVDELEEVRIRLDEVSRELAGRVQQVEANPARLDDIEARLALLEKLFRKYGANSEDVLARRQRIGEELEDLTLDDEGREALEVRMREALEAYSAAARKLSAERRRWSEALVAGVHRELQDLAMRRAKFSVEMSHTESSSSDLEVAGRKLQFGGEGIDDVSFELAANPGEAKGPLSAVASGGELSRVYLALRLAVGSERADVEPSLVFDEIDSGIGGAEAAALGKKLRRLASDRQVFAVTHLAQVASHGHSHYRVEKQVAGGRTRITVQALDAEARVEEVARMLAGEDVTSLSRSHAEELLAGVS